MHDPGSTITFRHETIDADGPRNPHVKATGDLDGDGRDEIIVASSNGGPLVWYDGPEWAKHVIAKTGKWSCDAAVVDMNGNGYPDIVISEWYDHDRIEWYENPLPDGDPREPWTWHAIGGLRAHDLEIGDIDGDGQLEIATRNQNQDGDSIVLWKQTAPDEWANRVLPCPAGEGLALGDVTGDGRLELILGGRWYECAGDLLQAPWTAHVFADWPPDAVVKVADTNADGRPDIVLTRSEGHHHLSWFEAPADPGDAWKEHVVEADLDFAHSLALHDLTGNGSPDIVTAEMHQSERRRVLVYVNGSAGEEWERHVLAETGSHNMCVADVAGTGKPAIIGANWSGHSQPVEVWQVE